MRMRYRLALLCLFLNLFGLAGRAQNQQPSTENVRRIVRKAPPTYPEIARKMNLGGTVRVVAVVAADGEVKSVEPVGGSPVLLKAAQDAVTKWKFAPGAGIRGKTSNSISLPRAGLRRHPNRSRRLICQEPAWRWSPAACWRCLRRSCRSWRRASTSRRDSP